MLSSFWVVAGENFCVDIDNSAIRYYFGFFFIFFSSYFVYTSACNLVFVFVILITVKVIVSVCEDGIKLNYFSIRFTETEP